MIEPVLKINFKHKKKIHIWVVGTGGTGSAYADALAAIAYDHLQRTGNRIQITLIDPDIVEDKNIGRQRFSHASLGRFKCEDIAERLNFVYGLGIRSIARPIDKNTIQLGSNTTHLIVDCVDNADARNTINEIASSYYEEEAWTLSCGNAFTNGHVLIGRRGPVELILNTHISHPPHPYVVDPGLLVQEKKPVKPVAEPSCADLVIVGEQSLLINRTIANFAAVTTKAWLDETLNWFNIRVSISPPSIQTTLTTASNLNAFWAGSGIG